MKKSIYILSLIIFILSCDSDKKVGKTEWNNTSTIIVEIPNAESEKLVLSIQGEDFENRKIETINNGKAIFEVAFSSSDVAHIESLYNIENIKGTRNWIPILLDNDTIIVKSKMIKESIRFSETEVKPYYVFKDIDYKRNSLNISYKKNSTKLFDLSRGVSLDWTILDSYNQNLFPILRTKTISLFNNEFSNLSHRIQLELLYKIINRTEFRPEYLDDENRKSINKIYYNLSNFDNSANYRLKTVEYSISNINNYGEENKLTFKNFKLTDINGNKVELKDIINQNKLTVFYFWYSSCGPCRYFIKNIDNETMKELNNNDIKFVSINTDKNKEDWIKVSKQDNIFWQNLYGGNSRDDIEYEYGFKGYPFKVIFNKNLDVIDFSFSKPKDLLELKDL